MKFSQITMAHGAGGKLTAELIDELFRPAFNNEALEAQHDGALLKLPCTSLAFTTDSYVIRPLFFPGGDIGKLAVTGTANDLAMCGARPRYLSCGLIIEEGFPTRELARIVDSMKQTAEEIGVSLVTGDTKVVDRGRGDGLYINTSGIGTIEHSLRIAPSSIQAGDAILVSGDIGRHGIAVLSVREGLEFEGRILSDCGALSPLVLSMLDAGIEIHCLRDLTRGGLATALVELADCSRNTFEIGQSCVPVREEVEGACEILGLDPNYVANEGRMVVFVPPDQASLALQLLRSHLLGSDSAVIGEVVESRRSEGLVVLKSVFGGARILDRLTGDQLPRIC